MSDVNEPRSSISASDGAESSTLVSDEPESPALEPDGSESSELDESESLSLSVRSGGNSELAAGASTGTMPLTDRPAAPGGAPQNLRTKGPLYGAVGLPTSRPALCGLSTMLTVPR